MPVQAPGKNVGNPLFYRLSVSRSIDGYQLVSRLQYEINEEDFGGGDTNETLTTLLAVIADLIAELSGNPGKNNAAAALLVFR